MKTWKYISGQSVKKNLCSALTFLSVLMLFSAITFSPTAMAADDAFHPADTDKNKIIDQAELDAYVELWQTEDLALVEAVKVLYLNAAGINGAYYWDPSEEGLDSWLPFTAGEGRIQLYGSDEIVVECTQSFNDPGAEAQDVNGALIPVTLSVTLDGTPVTAVDTGLSSTGGTFLVTYTAETQNGPISVTRQVLVVDTLEPVITPRELHRAPEGGEDAYWAYMNAQGWRHRYENTAHYPRMFYVQQLNCNADWLAMDGGTALDSCGDGSPVDYWENVQVIARLLEEDATPHESGTVYSVEEFTQYPGLYSLEYSVTDAAGNEATYSPDPDNTRAFRRYVEVMDTTPVPSVQANEHDLASAEAAILAANLNPVVVGEVYSDLEAGKILNQNPPHIVFPDGGDEAVQNYVPCGTDVELVVSLGPCVFPQGLVEMQLEDAITALTNAGFDVEVEEQDSWEPAGKILTYIGDPEACGTTITLVVSAEKCLVPDVGIEGTPEDAIQMFLDAGWNTPILKYDWAPWPAPLGTVYSQFPSPGEVQCDFQEVDYQEDMRIDVSMGIQPVSIKAHPSWEDGAECNAIWTDPGATVHPVEGPYEIFVIETVYATALAYNDGENWIAVDLDTPLDMNLSPYRVSYRYEFPQPNTEELGVLEQDFELHVVDTEPPVVTVTEEPHAYLEFDEDVELPYYMFEKGQYGHWDDVVQDLGITVSVWDLCEGDIAEDDIETIIVALDLAALEDEDNDDDLPTLPLDELGLDEDTWLSTTGVYVVAYLYEDHSGNDELSIRLVDVIDEIEGEEEIEGEIIH